MRPRWWIPTVWFVAMSGGIWFSATQLSIHNELGDLLPQGATSTQRVLLSQVRTGLSGRLILLAVEGECPDDLARISKMLGETLRASDAFGFVGNGAQIWSKDQQTLIFGLRYLLSSAITSDTFSESSLRNALELRLDDLRSPLAPLLKEWIPADPTGEIQGILRTWSGWATPEQYRGVWMSGDHTRALLVVETRAPGFDADAQEVNHQFIRASFQKLVQGDPMSVRLLMSGPGVFAVEIQRMIEAEAWVLSMVAGTLVLSFLFLSYRSVWLVLLSVIPISSGILAGMIAVNGWFGFVHGITLGFGITLLGMVDDYPIHLFSHMTSNSSAAAAMRSIWPTMRVGILTTAVGFSSLLLSGYPALAQLGLLSLVGLLTAAFVTRWILPSCVGEGFSLKQVRPELLLKFNLLRKGRPLVPIVLVLATFVLIWSDTPAWQQDLESVSPLPEDKKQLDQRLRQELGAPDVRDLLVIEAPTEEELLQKAETLVPKLEGSLRDGAVTGYEIVSRYLPSRRLQEERQKALPAQAVLEQHLATALKGLPFAPGVFAPFLAAVDDARNQKLIDRTAFAGTMLGMKLESLMFQSNDRWVAVVPLRGVSDRGQFARMVSEWEEGSTQYIDLKAESNQLMTAYRDRTVQVVAAGTLVIALALLLGVRSLTLVWRVLVPVVCSLVVVAALLRGFGVPLSLFHVATFLLVMGLGLDYALFLNRPEGTDTEQARTNYGLLVCSTTTILVFGVLACSRIPILQAIGLTAACGSFCCLLFAGMMARQEKHVG
jgi:predicted exporter